MDATDDDNENVEHNGDVDEKDDNAMTLIMTSADDNDIFDDTEIKLNKIHTTSTKQS